MKHIHKFRRVNIGQVDVHIDHEKNRKVVKRKEVWVMRCVKSNCSHYTRMATKLSCPLLKDNVAECNRCGEAFILSKRALRMTEPCCDKCVMRKKPEVIASAEQFFQELEKDIANDFGRVETNK